MIKTTRGVFGEYAIKQSILRSLNILFIINVFNILRLVIAARLERATYCLEGLFKLLINHLLSTTITAIYLSCLRKIASFKSSYIQQNPGQKQDLWGVFGESYEIL